MAKKTEQPTFEQAATWLRDNGFDILEAPGVANRIFVKKHNCSAAIEKDAEGGVRLFARPGYLISGEIAKLVDRGYQKFLKTTKAEIPATADHLTALRQFSEELDVATGIPNLYNQSLGSVSDAYMYDRVEQRDRAVAQRSKRPWEEVPAAKDKRSA